MTDLIKKILVENENNYEFFGLRYDSNDYEIGDECENSHNWWQDDPNEGLDEDDPWYTPYNQDMGLWDGGELNGTCAVEINTANIDQAVERIKSYANCGDNLILIAGNYAEGGNDIGEIIIANAVILEKF